LNLNARTNKVSRPLLAPWNASGLRLGRAKLYDEVWAEPARTVAKRYGISDTALRRRCLKLGIPLPPRGYWPRFRLGRGRAVTSS